MFQDDTRSLREEQSFAAIVARAFEWPPQATLVHGFLMSSSIAPVPVSSDESRFARIFCAQCPSTRAVVHLEVHTEFNAPSLAAFAIRAADAFSDWQRRSTQGPLDDIPLLKGRYSGTGKSKRIRRLDHPISPSTGDIESLNAILVKPPRSKR